MTFYTQELNSIGKLITIGGLDLSLTLRLEKSEIKNLNINLPRLKTLNDLSFIIENEILWEKIELSSKNELLNTLFHMNKIKTVKTIVAYLTYDKIEFNDEQKKFQKLLDVILLSNGVVIYPFNICKCKMNICFRIAYKTYIKKIMLYGEREYDNDELNMESKNEIDYNDSILLNMTNSNNNISPRNNLSSFIENGKIKSIINQKKEIKKEKKEEYKQTEEEEEENNYNEDNDNYNIGLFERINENEVNFNDFKYIYIHLKDYILNGEFRELFKLVEIYNFLRKIKKNSKIKIIFNFTEGLKSNMNYLLKFMKISDIHIFKKKSELIEILNKKIEEDNKNKQKQNRIFLDILKFKKTRLIKKIKTIKNRNKVNHNNSSSFSQLRLNKLNKSSEENSDNNYYTKKLENNKNQSLKNIFNAKSLNSTFDRQRMCLSYKNDIFNYIHNLLYDSSSSSSKENFNNKIGIYLDDFKKIFIAYYKPTKLKPCVIEYDLNIYPKSNVHNLTEIERMKEILYSKYSWFSYIINGCILNILLDDTVKEKEKNYLFYYYIRVSILKILSLIKKGIQIPTSKAFYIIELQKNELKKIIKEENTKKKENNFNMNYFQLNGVQKKEKRNSSISSISISKNEKYGTLYVEGSLTKEKFMEINQILNGTKTGNINFDFKTLTTKGFKKFCTKRNFNRFLWTRSQDKKDKKYTTTLIKRKIPKYTVNMSSGDSREKNKFVGKKLPPIKIQKQNVLLSDFVNSKFIKLLKGEEPEDVLFDTSKYKEIMLKPTPKE